MADDDVFAVTLECSNCGASWDRTFPPRTVVKREDYQAAVVHRDEDCQQLSFQECECCGHETCPVCDLRERVTVAERTPIEERSDDGE